MVLGFFKDPKDIIRLDVMAYLNPDSNPGLTPQKLIRYELQKLR